MPDNALYLLRELAKFAQAGISNPYAVDQLRFALELSPDGKTPKENAEQMRPAMAELLQSPDFLLEPLLDAGQPDESIFLVLAFPGVERTPAPESLFSIAAELREHFALISCEPDLGANVFVDPEPIPNAATESAIADTFCWVDTATPPDRRWALANTHVLDAWKISPLMGEGIRIAQPDTGITDHVEVLDARLNLADALNILEGGTDPHDPLSPGAANPGHGTGTASVVASGEGGQIAGAAPHAELIPIRCINDVKVFDGTPIAKAIEHAIKIGAHVVSMSLGGTPSRAVKRTIGRAVDADIIIVSAAGNCVPLVVWPARYDNVIAIGGNNINDKKWKGSSSGSDVAICAPAELVWRAEHALATDSFDKISGGQGTSFATALVAGIAALWLAHFKRADVVAFARGRGVSVQELFRAAIRQTARTPPGWDIDSLGAGIVDATALLSLPLANIALGKPLASNESAMFESLLETAVGPGKADSVFDWPAHGLEIASLALADAKNGANIGAGATEARASGRGASNALVEAAVGTSDPRISALALRSRRVQRAPRVSTPTDAVTTARLLRTLGATVDPGHIKPESTATISLEAARVALAPEQRAVFLDQVARRVVPAMRSGAGHELGQIESALAQLHERGLAATLSPEQTIRLEALVSLTGRPALPIVDGANGQQAFSIDLFAPTNAQKEELGMFSDLLMLAEPDILRSIASVGRIDVGGAHSGTGFVVGSGLVMTNRHVVETFAFPVPQAKNPRKWILQDTTTIDFSPLADDPRRRFTIKEVLFAGPEPILGMAFKPSRLDLALLSVESVNAAGTALPSVLNLARDGAGLPAAKPELLVCGYPAQPQQLPTDATGRTRHDVVERLREIFGLRYGCKYVSPGVVQAYAGAGYFEHDATSMPGNSGSAIFHFGPGMPIFGLHFAGDWLHANYAHALQYVRASGAVPRLEQCTWA